AHQRPRVAEREPTAAISQAALHRVQAQPDRLQRLDREPALVRPLADSNTVPRDQGGVEIGRLLDGEIREPRPDASLVDYPVAPVSARQRNVRLERRLDDTGVGVAPDEAGENAHVPTLDEAEASRPARDLRQLPREQRSPPLPVFSERSVRSPTHSSGSFRSKTLSSACGNARSTSGNASSAPSRRICRYSPASRSRVHAEPRSSSSAHCTSSRTRSSPLPGAISTVEQTIGAPSFTRSSPVTSATRSAPRRASSRRCASCASMRSGPAYTPTPAVPSPSSAACVFPEFVGPRWATTRSGAIRREGRAIAMHRL